MEEPPGFERNITVWCETEIYWIGKGGCEFVTWVLPKFGGFYNSLYRYFLPYFDNKNDNNYHVNHHHLTNGGEKGFKKEIRDLQEMLSKLNPMAKEFVPPSLVNCVNNNNVMYNSNFGYVNNFLTPPPNAAAGNVNGFPGRRRRNGFGQGKRRMNSRTSIAQREDVIRRTVY
ncbi:polyadenylate-binding protein-interacting protein 11-like [Spinacia oleracea]|uniref:Polyadenylate-binding protein-interacting protein 11-like n=1 Tax=Spinacia oleracea TaxID=3562 RepID=A0ABM3R4E1_SPIOL|nr:polyadenylate-binding protein-interacting protein 11-like [Spinacia oleracea]